MAGILGYGGLQNQLGYMDYMADEAQESMQLLKQKMKQAAQEAQRAQAASEQSDKSTQIFSPSAGSTYSAAGTWSDENQSIGSQSLNLFS